MDGPPTPALYLAKVARRYRQGTGFLEILRDAELAIFPGEVVALVAPSGTGKSTLLHVAGLLEKPDRGEVFVNGAPTSAMDDIGRTRLRREEIGFVYQFHHLLPEFSALENVVMPQLIGGLAKPEARARASELLRFLGLAERLRHRPAELSGGEQQRVAIARAVANAPRLLLADEPTGNLDPQTASQVFSTLNAIVRASGLAALVATHNLDLAARMDRARDDPGRRRRAAALTGARSRPRQKLGRERCRLWGIPVLCRPRGRRIATEEETPDGQRTCVRGRCRARCLDIPGASHAGRPGRPRRALAGHDRRGRLRPRLGAQPVRRVPSVPRPRLRRTRRLVRPPVVVAPRVVGPRVVAPRRCVTRVTPHGVREVCR